jgi:Domain of unknown function (DUF4296)
MKNWSFLLFLLLSCSGNGLPKGVLAKDQMEAVLWDMIQADQYYREYILKDSTKRDVRSERFKLYERVFEMHKTTRENFDISYAYYSAHPKLMKDVFDSLSDKGSRKLQDFYKPVIRPADTSARIKLKRE